MVAVRDAPVRTRGADHVLYWMIGQRRTGWNLGLQHAVARAIELELPLIVLEPLRAGYRWASDRLHRFVLDGMAANRAACAAAGVTYLPYVEPEVGAGRGLLEALARRAACVVTDELHGFFLPRMVAAAGARLDVRLETVDGAGVLPLRAFDRSFLTAMSFRRAWQAVIAPHLAAPPDPAPLDGLPTAVRNADIPGAVLRRWPAASAALLAGDAAALAALPIDHTVPPVATRGGAPAATARLADFLDEGLDRYGAAHRDPLVDTTSGLSFHLHFGHLAAHEVVAGVLAREGFDARRTRRVTGRKDGWWGLSSAAEHYLDELITWRELGHGFAFHRPDYDRYDSLPGWARATLAAHRDDRRAHLYTPAELAAAATDDPIWNAAQRQLVRDGRIDSYLRMLWGKRVLAWTRTPEQAFDVLVELNNRFAVDGRDANSYSGIAWTFGRFDRPWGPERPIYGNVRYMTSASTQRKHRLAGYLARYAAD